MTSARRVRRGRGRPRRARTRPRHRIGQAVAGTRTAPLGRARSAPSAAWCACPPGMRQPTLVLSTDGVGTKVLVALQAGRFDTVGEDLVNHSVNDILVHGAAPIAFMDYIAGLGARTWSRSPGIVEGIARGLPGARHGAGRRRDGADAGTLPAGNLRSRRHHHRRGRGGRGAARRRHPCPATCCSATPRPDSTPTATRWRGASSSSAWGSASTTALGDTGQTRRPTRSWRCTGATAAASARCSAGCTGSRTSPAAASPAIWCGCCPPDARRSWIRRCWALPPLFATLQQGGQISHRRDARRVQPRRRADRRPAAGRGGRRAGGRGADGVATWPMRRDPPRRSPAVPTSAGR